MMTRHKHDNPILVTGAAGAVGGIGRTVTEVLLAKGHKVRAMVRREDARAEALRRLGAEVVVGDLTDLPAMHRVIEGCRRVYFGMSVSPAYLEATINTAAVARHYGVEAFVNMSQMTVSQMSITETTDSPQHKLHWLAEQALSWSGLPVVTMRPTVFMEGFFLQLGAPAVRSSGALALPLGGGKISPVSAVDVARAVTVILEDPAPHIGQIYDLTGPEIDRPGTLRARLLRGARQAHPLSRRPTPGVERRPSAGEVSRAPRQASHGHGRVGQAGALRPHDGHPAQAHRRSTDEHARLRETPCRCVQAA